MCSIIVRLWSDDAGYLLSAESVFLFTILVLGLLAGWVAIRNSVVNELMEVSNSLNALDQSFGFSGLSNCTGAFTNGVMATDSNLLLIGSQTAPVLSSIGQAPCFP